MGGYSGYLDGHLWELLNANQVHLTTPNSFSTPHFNIRVLDPHFKLILTPSPTFQASIYLYHHLVLHHFEEVVVEVAVVVEEVIL